MRWGRHLRGDGVTGDDITAGHDNIVFGSDVPFGDPALNALITLRCALEAGLTNEQVESVMGAQLQRVLDGEPLADAGPAPGVIRRPGDPLLQRAITYLAATWGAALSGGSPAEPIALARMALTTPSVPLP